MNTNSKTRAFIEILNEIIFLALVVWLVVSGGDETIFKYMVAVALMIFVRRS